MYKSSSRIARRAGFTLIELIVVMVILGLLASLVLPKFAARQEQARRSTTIAQIGLVEDALELYMQDNGKYPSTTQGLEALVTEPTAPPKPRKWMGYMKQLPRDGWNFDFIYESPGSHSEDEDIVSWDLARE